MTAPPDRPRVAGYAIVGPLGSGGLGAVWRARRDDGAEVALKVLEPRRPVDAAVADRLFRREALAALNLDHPALVRALDAGRTADGRPWIAYELVEGPTLRDALRDRGALAEPEALELARRLASALDHAHRRGVVHGDVSPRNVMLAPDGARLVDLGLVRPLAEADGGPAFATPGSSPPEVVAGRPATAASDLFALGMTVACALLGRPLLPASSAAEYERALDSGEPALPTEACGPGLRAVLERCLRRDPAARYRSAAELLLDLDAVRAGDSPLGAALATAGVRLGARRRRAAVAAIAALGIATVAGALLLAPRGDLPAPAAPPPPAPGRDPLLARVEALRVLVGREGADLAAAEALAKEIEGQQPAGDTAAAFRSVVADLERRRQAEIDAIYERNRAAARAALAAGDRAAWRRALLDWPASLAGSGPAVAAREEVEKHEASARDEAAAADRRIAELEAGLAAIDPASTDAADAVAKIQGALAAVDADPAATAERRERTGRLRASAAAASEKAAAGARERDVRAAWVALADGLARSGDVAGFRNGLAALAASVAERPAGATGALVVDLDRRVRAADAAVARALAGTVGRAWARCRGDRIVVELCAEAPTAQDSLGPWGQNIPPLPGEREYLSAWFEYDLVRITGDRETAFCWELAQGFFGLALYGPDGGTATGLRGIQGVPSSGPAEPTHARWFTMELFQGLRPTVSRQPVNPGTAVTDAWDNLLLVREGKKPDHPLPERPASNPLKQAGLDAYLADDLPGAWTRLEQAAERDPLDAEVAILRARVLRDAAAPLPTLPIRLFALSEARRAWDLDPGLAAAPSLVAEIALEILDLPGTLVADVRRNSPPPKDPDHLRRLLTCVATLACEETVRTGKATPAMLLHLGRVRWDAGAAEEARALLRRAREALGDGLPAWAAEILR